MAKGSSNNQRRTLDLYHVSVTVFVSFLAWPITFFFNNGFEKIDQTGRTFWMMSSGFLILATVIGLVAKLSYVNDWFFYGTVLFAFTCMIDLIIALEYNGFIFSFMSEYLKMGEPYLHSPWGSAISLFDGIGFYFMYLAIVFQISNGKSWRSTGIYWGAGIINSMVVLLFGVFSGKHSPTFCTFLNVPYVLFPIFGVIRAFCKEERSKWSPAASSGLFKTIFDLVLALGFLTSIWVNLAKGFGSLGSEFGAVQYLLKHEPALYSDDPAPFAKIQSFVYLFYIVPIQAVSLLYIFRSERPRFLWDLGLVHAGIMLQAQFSFICSALDPQRPKLSQSDWSDGTFWFANLLILVVPHLYLLHLRPHRQSANLKKKHL